MPFNSFDRISPLPALEPFLPTLKPRLKRSFLNRVLRRSLRYLLYITHLQRVSIDAGIETRWLNDFNLFWRSILHGRPLKLPDFHYLHGSYRSLFQSLETPESADPSVFLASWQESRSIFQLFNSVRRFAYEPLHGLQFERWVNNGDTILEYGCGFAPVTDSLLRYTYKTNVKYSIADINQINSRYAEWRLSLSSVNYIHITPFQTPPIPPSSIDVIFLITVMEHLPDPLVVVKQLTSFLKPSGRLVFDYILGDGDGQDTQAAIDQRAEVLTFLSDHYNLLHGSFSVHSSMSTTVIEKL